MSAKAVLKQPLRLTPWARPAGVVRTAPPGRTSKLRTVRATRLAPPDLLQEEKLVETHRSAPPTMWKRRPSSSSP